MLKTAVALSALGIALCWSAGVVAADATKPAAERAPTAQQLKMKTCNAQAKERQLKGEERKAFMSSCLKSEKKA